MKNADGKVTDISSFEEELLNKLKGKSETNKVNPSLDKNDLVDFEEQLKESITNSPQQQTTPVQPQNKTIKVKKNLVISFVSDSTGCGHIRNVFPFTFLNSIFGKSQQFLAVISPFFIVQPDFLGRARTLFFQRQMSEQHLQAIIQYKKMQGQYRYRMVWDMDDFIWGLNEEQGGTRHDGVPSYNFGAKSITKSIKKSSVEVMKLMDVCTFSTQFLADYAKNVLKIPGQCVVVNNVLPKYFWGDQERDDITETIKKPRVLYVGSPTHYNNERKMLGDFNNSWRDWIIKSVKEDKITFIVLGGCPWFLEPIKDKIEFHDWVDSFGYHLLVKKMKADIGIGPLVPNNFNHSKSDIKYLEHIAIGSPFIGSVFTNGKPSPYDVCELTQPDDCTTEDIQKMVDDVCQVKKFNEIKNKQYKWMSDNNRWMESAGYVNLMTSIF
jgi:hypothetical protein